MKKKKNNNWSKKEKTKWDKKAHGTWPGDQTNIVVPHILF